MSSFTYNTNISAYVYVLDNTGNYNHTYNWFVSMGCQFSTYHRSNGDVKFTFEVISEDAIAQINAIFSEVDEEYEEFPEVEGFEEFEFNSFDDFNAACGSTHTESFSQEFEDFLNSFHRVSINSDRFGFNACSSASEMKSLYRTLAKQHHPDLGGSVELMAELNAAYERAVAYA